VEKFHHYKAKSHNIIMALPDGESTNPVLRANIQLVMSHAGGMDPSAEALRLSLLGVAGTITYAFCFSTMTDTCVSILQLSICLSYITAMGRKTMELH
jgi:hypothetical protein